MLAQAAGTVAEGTRGRRVSCPAMASRQEEKEQRRREREEAEKAAQRSEARRKRIGMVVGGVLVAALIVVIVLAVLPGGDDRGPGAQGSAPSFGVADLEEAAEAANCELRSHEEEGNEHTSEDVEYETNPPTSGDHDPVPAEDGIYSESPPDLEASVHSLEHGRINFQYAPGAPGNRVNQLEAMVEEEVKGTPGYHSLMFENQTDMDAAVAATAWVQGEPQSITCAEWNDRVFDALRAFRLEYIDKGPEFIP